MFKIFVIIVVYFFDVVFCCRTYRIAFENLRSGLGPVANTASAVSAYPNDGTLLTLETSCDVFTYRMD